MQEVLPPKHKEFKDDWDTTARQGYEDLGPARPKRAAAREPGSPILKTLGGLAIFGGICWVTYLVTQAGSINSLRTILEQNHGPVAIVGLGAVTSLVGKYMRV